MPTNKMLTLVGIVLMSAALSSSADAETLKLEDELTVYYEVTGTGQIPIVFVPGWTMSTKVFDKQHAHFALLIELRKLRSCLVPEFVADI